MPQIRLVSSAPPPPSALTQLLARLSPEERTTLRERRLGPNAAPVDLRELASQLANPTSAMTALAQINNGQLLLLRWLAERPHMRASWSELTEALGDRLSPELLLSYLQDLRLWALADFDSNPKDGFFTTYPTVIAALPTGHAIHLRPRLELLNSDVLLKVCQALELTKPPTRKDERVEQIVSTLTDPATCQAAVLRLSGPAQHLFAWVRERGGWVSADEMNRRVTRRATSYGSYGGIDAFFRPLSKGQQPDPLTDTVRCMLIVPVTAYAGSWYAPSAYAIAAEVEQAFSGRGLLDSSPLQAPPIARAEQVDGTIPNPANILRDVGHLLGFVGAGRCEWRQDGQPYKRSLVAFGKLLGYKDAAYAETIWELAASAGLVRPKPGVVPTYETAPLSDFSAPQLFSALILAWIHSGAMAADDSVMPAQAQHARANLVQLLRLIPPDTWLLRSSVEAALRFHWPTVFAPEYQIAGTTVPAPGWDSLGSFFLGHGLTPDGQPAVMLPAAHQPLLYPAPDDVEGVLPPWDNSWIVQPDRTVVVPPNAHPKALIDLWKVAQLQSSQGASVFRVTPESIAAALNRYQTPTQIRATLQGGSRVPLPPTVERLIDDQGQRFGRIKVGAAHTYVRVDDPALLAELKRHKKLNKLTWVDVAPGVAFVVSSEPLTVLENLRQAGFLPVMDAPTKAAADKTSGPRLISSNNKKGGRQTAGIAPQERRTLLRLINRAIEDDTSLRVTWWDQNTPTVAELEPIDVHDDELHAYYLDKNDAEVLIPFDSILKLAAGDPLDELLTDDEEPE